MHKTSTKSIGGWTLIELMVVIVILTVLSIAIFATYTAGVDTWNRRSVYATIQADARRALEGMTREIHQASFNSPYGINANGSSLEFEVLQSDSSWSHIRYYLGGANGTTLMRNEGGSVTVLANNILGLTFTWNSQDPRVIDINIQVAKADLLGQTAQVDIRSEAAMRN